jgi:hypothetical protein
MLDPHSSLPEVLWMFSRFPDEKRRLTLSQNPHFYERLPTLPEAYGGEFGMDPIRSLQQRISVLIDIPDQAGRVILETAGEIRVFGNLWVLNNVIIFKGLCLLFILFPSLTPF